jgi:hypothetical protein
MRTLPKNWMATLRKKVAAADIRLARRLLRTIGSMYEGESDSYVDDMGAFEVHDVALALNKHRRTIEEAARRDERANVLADVSDFGDEGRRIAACLKNR